MGGPGLCRTAPYRAATKKERYSNSQAHRYISPCGRGRICRSLARSILRGPLNVIDYENLDGASARFEFKAELFLERGEYGG